MRSPHYFQSGLFALMLSTLLFMGDSFAATHLLNVHDQDLEEVVPNVAFTKRLPGQALGVELFLMKAGTRPYTKGESHNHPQEYMAVKFDGEAKFTVEGGENRAYTVRQGDVMLIPPGLQHRGGHGDAEDSILLVVFSPRRVDDFNYVPPAVADANEELREPYYANIDAVKRTEVLRDQVFTKDVVGTRIGIQLLKIKGVGGRADTVLSGRAAADEEVAVVYRGQVKVTSGTDARILKAGDVYHSDRPIFYQRIGDQDVDIVRVFSTTSADAFDLR